MGEKIQVGDWVAFMKRDKLVYAEVYDVEEFDGGDGVLRLQTTEGSTTSSEVLERRMRLQ